MFGHVTEVIYIDGRKRFFNSKRVFYTNKFRQSKFKFCKGSDFNILIV